MISLIKVNFISQAMRGGFIFRIESGTLAEGTSPMRSMRGGFQRVFSAVEGPRSAPVRQAVAVGYCLRCHGEMIDK